MRSKRHWKTFAASDITHCKSDARARHGNLFTTLSRRYPSRGKGGSGVLLEIAVLNIEKVPRRGKHGKHGVWGPCCRIMSIQNHGVVRSKLIWQ